MPDTPSSAATTPADGREIRVKAADLPLHCPLPGAPLWARHPRVFLDVLATGEALCPYCGTRYVFTGDKPHGHH